MHILSSAGPKEPTLDRLVCWVHPTMANAWGIMGLVQDHLLQLPGWYAQTIAVAFLQIE